MENSHTVSLQNTPAVAGPLPGGDLLGVAGRFLESLFSFTRLAGLYEGIRSDSEELSFVDRALARLNVTYQVVRGAVDSIPREGPLVIVANHPFGGAEGLALMSLLDRVRPDVKFMATRMLGGIDEIRSRMFMVDPFGGADAAAQNVAPLRQCLRWVRNGGALVIFPAGEVAHWDWRTGRVRESDWHETVARLVRHARATVFPVFFEGANGPLFQAAGLVHPRLRTALLARELVNKAHHSLKVRLGRPIPFEKLAGMESDGDLTRYLRLRVLLLGVAQEGNRKPSRSLFQWARPAPVAAAESADKLAAEIRWLPPEAKLAGSGDYTVYIAGPRQIPGILREITRLREVTFRAAGEGSGLALDRDVFDQIYQHLFV
ncbi:MAG: 1-acyl-sn-glycerol-3-phosphate acyltransferase, partial [bacterium]